MVDTKSSGDKTLSVPSKTLTLKPRVETGTVRQSFSHGRSKQVVVEKRGKRRLPGETAAPAAEAPAPEPVVKAAPATVAKAPGVAVEAEEDEGPRQIRRGPGGVMRPAAPPKTTHRPGPQKQRGRLTVVTALTADDVRERSIASFRRRTQRLKGHAA